VSVLVRFVLLKTFVSKASVKTVICHFIICTSLLTLIKICHF
jgi:hypothetical protein